MATYRMMKDVNDPKGWVTVVGQPKAPTFRRAEVVEAVRFWPEYPEPGMRAELGEPIRDLFDGKVPRYDVDYDGHRWSGVGAGWWLITEPDGRRWKATEEFFFEFYEPAELATVEG